MSLSEIKKGTIGSVEISEIKYPFSWTCLSADVSVILIFSEHQLFTEFNITKSYFCITFVE